MRVPLSWLREYVSLAEPVGHRPRWPGGSPPPGLEVESVESVGHDIRGVVVAEVLSIEELTGLRRSRSGTARSPFPRAS